MLNYSTAIIAVIMLPLAVQAQLPAAGNAGSPFAGKTCVAFYDFGHGTINYKAKAAFFFKPDGAGAFELWVKYGKEAIENYNKVSSPDGYRPIGTTRMDGHEFDDLSSSGLPATVALIRAGPDTFDLVRTSRTNGGPWFGKAQCK